MSARLIGSVTNRTIFKRLFKFELWTAKKIHLALHEIGGEGVMHMRDLMSEKKTGRIYIIKGLDHQASAPGEAPAILSQKLYRSLYYKVRGSRQLEFGSNMDEPYPQFLEKGTAKMEPRSYLERMINDKRSDNMHAIVSYALDRR